MGRHPYHYLRRRLCVFFVILSLAVFPVSLSYSSDDDPSLKEQMDKEGYIVDLQNLIKKSKKKIEEVDTRLKEQAKRRRNQQREEKAREYYDKAMQLSEKGNLKQAQEFWKKAIKITSHPEMKGYIRESVKRTKKQAEALRKEETRRVKRLEVERGYSADEVEKAYDEAVTFYRQKSYLEARDQFELVEEMFPDHKATRSYLMVIDQEIQREQQEIIERKIKEEAVVKRKEKEVWRKEIERKEKERQDELQNQAESVYQEALKLYKARQFEDAKEKFKEVEWILPDYRATLKYLSRIDRDIKYEKRRVKDEEDLDRFREAEEDKIAEKRQKEKRRRLREENEVERIKRIKEEADFVYKSALSLYKDGDYEEAKDRFLEVLTIHPDYKSTRKYVSKIENLLEKEKEARLELERKEKDRKAREIELAERRAEEERLREQERKERGRLDQIKSEADFLYTAALRLYKNKLYKDAEDKFYEVSKLIPEYKGTQKYLKRISKKLKQEEKLAKVKERPTPQMAGKGEMQKVELPAQVKEKIQAIDDNEIIQEAERERRKKFIDEAESKYKEALEFYKDKNYVEAKMKFIQVEALYPDYKSTLDYLRRIDEGILPSSADQKDIVRTIKKEKKKEIKEVKGKAKIERLYSMALAQYKDKQYEEARDTFLEVTTLKPSYKSTRKYLSRIERKMAKQSSVDQKKKEEKVKRDKGKPEIERLYNDALDSYKAKSYVKSREQFTKINLMHPSYKKTEKYLEKLDNVIAKEIEKNKKKKQKELSKKSVEELDEMLDDVKSAEMDWKQRRDERVVLLKAKEEHLKELEGERYKEFKKMIQDEYRTLDEVEKERKRRTKQRKKEMKQKLKRDEEVKRKEEKERVRFEKIRHKEMGKKLKEERAAKLKEEKEAERLAHEKQLEEERRQREEERKRKQEEMAKQKEEERKQKEEKIAKQREEKQKAKEDERKRIDEEIAKLKEEKRKLKENERIQRQEEIAKQKEEKRKQKEERIAKKKEEKEKKRLERLKKNGKSLGEKEQPAESAKTVSKDFADKEVEDYDFRAYKEKQEKIKAKGELARIRKEENRLQKRQKKELKKQRKKIQRSLARKEKTELRTWQPDVEVVYREAINLYRKKDYSAAKAKFSMVEAMHPGYKLAKFYASRSLSLMTEEERRAMDQAIQEEEREKKFKEKKEQDEMRQKEREEQEEARQREREEKEQARLQYEQEQAAKKANEKHLKETKKQIEVVYTDAVDLYKNNQIALSKAKFTKFEELLKSAEFSEKYLKKMNERLNRDRTRLKKELEKKRLREEAIAKRDQERLEKVRLKVERERQKELAKLEQKVKREEERLQREKREEELKLLREKEREDAKKRKEEMIKMRKKKKRAKVKDEKVDQSAKTEEEDQKVSQKQKELQERKKRQSEKEKRNELRRLIKERQKELELEREQIQRDFNDNLERLYAKAVKFYQDGLYAQAKRMFREVHNMYPNYKKTKHYLTKISSEEKNIPRSSESQEDGLRELERTRQDIISESLNKIEQNL